MSGEPIVREVMVAASARGDRTDMTVSPHEFVPLRRWRNRGRCRACLADEALPSQAAPQHERSDLPLMEITVFPRAFSIAEQPVPQPDGETIVAHRIQILDAGGTIVNVMFGQQDWESFQRFVADPAGETSRAEARAKIAMPPSMAASIKSRPAH